MDHHDHIVIVVAGALLLASCSPRIVERVVVHHDTTTVHHRDSIHHLDSIYIREWMRGDTVFVDRFRDRYIYKDRWRDSIVTKVDSFAVETIKEVQVEKPLSWGKRAKIGAFWWLVSALILCAGWIFRKPLVAILKTWLKF